MRNRHRSTDRNTRKTDPRGRIAWSYTTQVADQLAHLPLTVRANGYGCRIECNRCGWSTAHGVVQAAIDHAATH